MSVQRIQFEVHGTGECETDTYTEEDGAIGVDADVEVGHEDVVHGAAPLVAEECVRHPDLARLRDGEVLDLVWTQQSGGQTFKKIIATFHLRTNFVTKLQSVIIPLLSARF